MLIKVDYKDITLSRLCHYYLSESTRGTNTKTMFFLPYIYIYISLTEIAQILMKENISVDVKKQTYRKIPTGST